MSRRSTVLSSRGVIIAFLAVALLPVAGRHSASAAQDRTDAPPPRALSDALAAAAAGKEHLGEALRTVPDRIIRDEANADALIAVVASWDLAKALQRVETTSQLAIGLGLMQNAIGEPIQAKLQQGTSAKLLTFADEMIAAPKDQDRRDLIFLLQELAIGRTAEGAERVIRAARAGIGTDERLWPIVFDPYSVDSPAARQVVAALADPIPPGTIGLGLLDCANGLRLEGIEIKHPFDTDAGVARLEEWLKTPEGESIGPAQSAAAALPFLTHGRRNQLLQQAVDHPHPLMKAEAGWALVMLEDQRGIRLLQAVARDVRYSVTAQLYLEELDAADQIPAEVKEQDFAVRAEFCHFLGLPDQLGEAPDEIKVLGSQVLNWPPTNDRRRMSVVRFAYKDADGKVTREGVGVVGNLTAWLPDLSSVDMPAGDMLALHCAYELQALRDPRAPKEVTAAAGMTILRAAQSPNR
ncbi:MAG TPA: hypothetical protein PLI18_03290 [Pirellulaceae bacterium]|nr:hypothetical protein [Pirellulaceae bacterium]